MIESAKLLIAFVVNTVALVLLATTTNAGDSSSGLSVVDAFVTLEIALGGALAGVSIPGKRG